jgi:Response regulator of the LytR/AlgR family
MKKVCLIVGYWLAAILLTTLLLLSLDYDLWVAVAMSLTFLPSAMALSFFLPKVDRAKRRNQRILDTIFIILGVMTTAFLFIYVTQFLTYSSIGPTGFPEWDLPSMLGNPIFVAAVLALLAYGNYRLERWLEKRFPSDRPIVFTSDYHRVSVKKEDILYVESRDSEVWVFTWDGNQYRNKTGINQWENLLGDGFLRIHRAFLVNVEEAVLSSPDVVTVAGKELPVSRKYKENVKAVLAAVQDAGPESPASNKNL